MLSKSIKKVEGFLTDKEMNTLYELAKKGSRNGSVVEIGSWKGKSTICLAMGLKAKKLKEKIYAVDWHRGSKEHGIVNTLSDFKRNIKKHGVSRYVIPMVMKSEEAARKWSKKKPIRLLWIDGSHDYKDVRKDFLLWSPFLVKGGVIAFHDSLEGGPKKIVDKYIFGSDNFCDVRFVNSITYARKEKCSSLDKTKKLVVLVKKETVTNLWKLKKFLFKLLD